MSERSFSLGSFYGTYTCAGTAVDTFILVDYVLAIAFADGADGTFLGASAACDAIVGNNVCHENTPPHTFFRYGNGRKPLRTITLL